MISDRQNLSETFRESLRDHMRIQSFEFPGTYTFFGARDFETSMTCKIEYCRTLLETLDVVSMSIHLACAWTNAFESPNVADTSVIVGDVEEVEQQSPVVEHWWDDPELIQRVFRSYERRKHLNARRIRVRFSHHSGISGRKDVGKKVRLVGANTYRFPVKSSGNQCKFGCDIYQGKFVEHDMLQEVVAMYHFTSSSKQQKQQRYVLDMMDGLYGSGSVDG
jgi:hypothetical protein